jgi:uncharacterized repeat protein (TIGR03803 family)
MARVRSLIVLLSASAVMCLVMPTSAPVLAASRFKVLHSFNSTDGANPLAGLISDTVGNLYGTTASGGANSQDCPEGCGTVFELAPGANGKWTETVLHYFTGKDGGSPEASLTLDGEGNLYGTTALGGTYSWGTVFKLTPSTDGKWAHTVLHTFSGKDDGGLPTSSLTFDIRGNLYGTTQWGGNLHYCSGSGCGTVFELAPDSSGKWTQTVLHSFNGKDGTNPPTGLVFDLKGNLYSVTSEGGAHGVGTVFELSPSADGKWVHTVLHSFDNDGQYPVGGVVLNAAGNLYGTTSQGGRNLSGILFKLVHRADGKWVEKVLHSFGDADGDYPQASLIFDPVGNLYGTTGGFARVYGAVFKLGSDENGEVTETVLHDFSNGTDGAYPDGGLILDKAGNLYGTAYSGGGDVQGCNYGCGVVFEITQ